MTDTKDLILKLREVRDQKKLSYNNILALMEQNGDHLSTSTLSNVFSGDIETVSKSLSYEYTLRPIANALLDLETIEANDDMDTQAMKVILQYKIQRIEELESALAKEQVKYHDKMDKERQQFDKERKLFEEERESHARQIAFLNRQIELKDKRMDQLLDAVFQKDNQHQELLKLIMSCPARNGMKCEE